MPTVGLIVNPASGRDIRRLVAQAWVITHQEKIAIAARLLRGLMAAGVTRVLTMPEPRGIGQEAASRIGGSDSAAGGSGDSLELSSLPMRVTGRQEDSTTAARLLAEAQVGCIITLGGDGTNRAVFKGCGPEVPLLPVSTGTNNVFSEFHEGTTAGYAAGLLATGQVSVQAACAQHKVLRLARESGEDDVALVDIAVAAEQFIGARAIWEVSHVRELFLTRGEPWNVGLSAIGGSVQPIAAHDPRGLHLKLGGDAPPILAPIAPGLYRQVAIAAKEIMHPGQTVTLTLQDAATVALDGERDLVARAGEAFSVTLDSRGPLVLDVKTALGKAVSGTTA